MRNENLTASVRGCLERWDSQHVDWGIFDELATPRNLAVTTPESSSSVSRLAATANTEFLGGASKDPRRHKKAKCTTRFDVGLRDLVLKADRHLFEKFGYSCNDLHGECSNTVQPVLLSDPPLFFSGVKK